MKKLALILTFLVTSMTNAGDEVGGGGGSRIIVKTVNNPFMNSGGGGGGPRVTLKDQLDDSDNLFGPVTGGGMGAKHPNDKIQLSDVIGGGGGSGHTEIPKLARISAENIEGIINYRDDFIDKEQLSQGRINLSLDGAQIDESWLYINPRLVKEVLVDGRYYSAKELIEDL